MVLIEFDSSLVMALRTRVIGRWPDGITALAGLIVVFEICNS